MSFEEEGGINAFPAEGRCPRCDGYGIIFKLGVRCLDPFHDQAILDLVAQRKADRTTSRMADEGRARIAEVIAQVRNASNEP